MAEKMNDVEKVQSTAVGPDLKTGEIGVEVEQQYGHTKRGLKSRHIQFIALGGCIGTGLFVGSGAVLADVGPASLFLSYVFMSTLIWAVMNVLGEITTYLPVSGASVPMYVNRFVDPSLAFAAGWNYWYAFTMLVAAEVSAAAIVIQYWHTHVPLAVWITIVLLVILALNIFVVSLFGEAEFWFSSLKLIAICGLIILGIVLFFGGGPSHDRLGFRYWKHDQSFREYEADGSLGKFLGFWHAVAKAGFSFVLSPELISLAAGEAESPRRNIPKATQRFTYRLVAFYMLGSLVIGVIVWAQDPLLVGNLGAGTAKASPFVVGIQRAGIKYLDHMINAVILTSAWSAGNSYVFAAGRSLYSLALQGQAPRIFKRCNAGGVPYLAVGFSWGIACLAYLNVSSAGAQVFNWFQALATISGLIAWIIVLVTYLRFRGALICQGLLDARPFRTVLQPYLSYYAIFILAVILLTSGFAAFIGKFNVSDFLTSYITIPIFVAMYLGHKLWFRTPWAIPLDQVDVLSGKEEADRLEEMDVPPVPRNWLERFWFWIA